MVVDPIAVLVRHAAELRRVALVPYDEFVKSVQQLYERRKNDLVIAPPDEVFTVQGRCQALAELVKKLEDCSALDEQYRKRT